MRLLESNKQKVSNIIELVQKYELNTSSRKRDNVYRRAFLMFQLRKLGCVYEYIGSIFNRDHATVIHAIEVHKMFKKDLVYKLSTTLIEEELKLMNENVCSNIYEDVLTAQDFNDLLTIKQKIEMGVYN